MTTKPPIGKLFFFGHITAHDGYMNSEQMECGMSTNLKLETENLPILLEILLLLIQPTIDE